MIPFSSQRGSGQDLATHLLNAYDNELAEVVELRAVGVGREHEIVAARVVEEVLQCVVDDVVVAARACAGDVVGAAPGGDFGTERLGDLYREAAVPARRAIDQHLLPGLEATAIAQSLQRGDRRDGHGGCLRKTDVGGLGRQPLLGGAPMLGEGAATDAEDRVAALEAGDARADGFHFAGDVDPDPDRAGRLSHAAQHQPGEPRLALPQPPVEGIDRRGTHAQQDFALAGHRRGHVHAVKHLQGRAELRVLDGAHRASGVSRGQRRDSLALH